MQTQQQVREKKVTIIPATVDVRKEIQNASKLLRVAAYCRISTKQEEQLNSYEVQVSSYTEKITREPNWIMVGIFADRGISGTSVKKRDEFNKLMRLCKRGKVDMIITKSISRFARNTVDCLRYIRMLNDCKVDVFFEEQGIHSNQTGSEFYITIFGSLAQSESENISANIKWGKQQSAKAGNVPFQYKNFLGYRRGEDGKPEIDPEQAEIVIRIYDRFLDGDSLQTIANGLNADGIPTPSGEGTWVSGTIQSILTNVKYKGDAIINKTFIKDCISKKVMPNTGERPMYYVQNNHPAIIDSAKFARVQEELARRTGKRKTKQKGTKTESGKYSSKYALSELLICGECGTPYRRCTWTASGEKKIVWRCISRIDFGKKYCHQSPTIKEQYLHEAIMKGISKSAGLNGSVLESLKLHIRTGLAGTETADDSMEIQLRIAQIDAQFAEMLKAIASDNMESFDDSKAKELMDEKAELQQRLRQIEAEKQKRESAGSRLEDMFTVLDALANHPLEYDDRIVRKILDCVVVENKHQIRIVFKGGLEITQEIETDPPKRRKKR